MKINEVLVEAPTNLRTAGGVPNAVNNLKANQARTAAFNKSKQAIQQPAQQKPAKQKRTQPQTKQKKPQAQQPQQQQPQQLAPVQTKVGKGAIRQRQVKPAAYVNDLAGAIASQSGATSLFRKAGDPIYNRAPIDTQLDTTSGVYTKTADGWVSDKNVKATDTIAAALDKKWDKLNQQELRSQQSAPQAQQPIQGQQPAQPQQQPAQPQQSATAQQSAGTQQPPPTMADNSDIFAGDTQQPEQPQQQTRHANVTPKKARTAKQPKQSDVNPQTVRPNRGPGAPTQSEYDKFQEKLRAAAAEQGVAE